MCQSHSGVVGLKFHSFGAVMLLASTFDLTLPILSALSTSCPLCPSPHPHHPPLSSLSWSQAKVDNEVIDYRDLAAIPRVKAIYDIEHPDMISYKSVSDSPSTMDNKGSRQDRQSPAEVTASHALCVLVWFMSQTK